MIVLVLIGSKYSLPLNVANKMFYPKKCFDFLSFLTLIKVLLSKNSQFIM